MPYRHAISDADWERIQDLLPGRPGQTGWRARDNRLFLDKGQRGHDGPPGRGSDPPHLPNTKQLAKTKLQTALERHTLFAEWGLTADGVALMMKVWSRFSLTIGKREVALTGRGVEQW